MNKDRKVTNYSYLGSAKILETEEGKVVLKKKTDETSELYSYLKTRGFHQYLENKELTDEYEIYPFIEEVNIPAEQKAIDLMYILSMLHTKTTFYKEIDIDQDKEIYDRLHQKIIDLMRHYHDIQNQIEEKIYYSPSEYLLIRNISSIYYALDYSLKNLNDWYDEKSTKTKQRVVLLHNKIETDHILISNDIHLISWNHAKYDTPIYDFINFYKKEYLNFEMNSLFSIYSSKYNYTSDEMYLFFAILTIPDKITIKKEHYQNTYEIIKLIKYIEITNQFILKENQKRPVKEEQKLNE